MNGSKFLQGLYVPEISHCPFPSSERLVRVLGPVVKPTTAGLGGRIRSPPLQRPCAVYAAKRNPRVSSSTRRNSGSGATHMVLYVFRKGSQYSDKESAAYRLAP